MLDTSAEVLTCRIRDIEKIEAECRWHNRADLGRSQAISGRDEIPAMGLPVAG